MATGSILVVEDDPTLVHAITRNLAARGYEARSATTVAVAVSAITEEVPAVVLLDINLPDGSGWEVVRALDAAGHRDVPVIVMSALRPNPRLCAEVASVAVLEKPFPMDSLIRLVTKAMSPSPEPLLAEIGSDR